MMHRESVVTKKFCMENKIAITKYLLSKKYQQLTINISNSKKRIKFLILIFILGINSISNHLSEFNRRWEVYSANTEALETSYLTIN